MVRGDEDTLAGPTYGTPGEDRREGVDMKDHKRSGCPISYSLEVLGDRWSLLVLRDIAFRQSRYFQDFLDSGEGIASNILTVRLRRLERRGVIEKRPDPEDGRRSVYALTAAGLDLIPVLVDLTIWGGKHDPESTFPRPRLARMERDREGAVRYYRERAG
jgi:DNA-binding HxlR family transcriptional regulator